HPDHLPGAAAARRARPRGPAEQRGRLRSVRGRALHLDHDRRRRPLPAGGAPGRRQHRRSALAGRKLSGRHATQDRVFTWSTARRPAPASVATSLAVSTYPVCELSTDFANTIPKTLPLTESSGPPELPGSILA